MIYHIDAIEKIAHKIIESSHSKIICLYGEMGAGKTTLTKALVKELGGADVNSPTFGIVNEYHLTTDELLGFHFDFYRINDEMEALDLGFEDYINQDVWIFIEWPEKISSFIPDNATHININIIDNDTREIVFD